MYGLAWHILQMLLAVNILSRSLSRIFIGSGLMSFPASLGVVLKARLDVVVEIFIFSTIETVSYLHTCCLVHQVADRAVPGGAYVWLLQLYTFGRGLKNPPPARGQAPVCYRNSNIANRLTNIDCCVLAWGLSCPTSSVKDVLMTP